MRMFVIFIIIISKSVFCYSFGENGYGDWPAAYTGYPSLRERRIHVLTNACRISPREYRDTFLVPENSQASDILLEENYPSVPPLYWHTALNTAARTHSIDMAENHGLSHYSSDGTDAGSRILSYYSNSNYWGENIATGRNNALETMRQWLLDITDYSTQTPAPDNSSSDGHRANIMNSNFIEIGAGYAYGPQQYNHFWTMDLGAGESDYSTPVTSGCHFFLENDSILFMATYTDSENNAPLSSEVITDKNRYELSLLMGNSGNGTYFAVCPPELTGSEYNFRFSDAHNSVWKYPENGNLKIAEDEQSEQGYVKNRISGFNYLFCNLKKTDGYIIKKIQPDKLTVIKTNETAAPQSYEIFNLKGHRITRNYIDLHNTENFFYVPLEPVLADGIYILKISDNNLRFNVLRK